MTARFRLLCCVVLAMVLSALLPVHVLAQPAAPKVALLAADATAAAEDVRTHLVAAGYDVTIIDVAAGSRPLERPRRICLRGVSAR